MFDVSQTFDVNAPVIATCESTLAIPDVSASDDVMSHVALPWFVDHH